jgi:quercetin dioxygenase-like cupin family protein
MMRKLLLCCLVLVTGASAQAPVAAEQEPFHKQIFRNENVQVVGVEIPPHQTTQLHRHEHDYLAVSLTDATVTTTVPGKDTVQEKRQRGEARMGKPVVHAVRNDGNTPYRATAAEFLVPQGEVKPVNDKPSRYCNPNSKTACVAERYLFCTARICVSDVEMGPGAVTMKHTHSTDHMLIAVSDLDMKDWIEGQAAAVMRQQKSGEVLFVAAGITHQLVNGPTTARMIVVSWK